MPTISSAWQSVLQTGDAVVVVPNYRLGPLGWLSSWQLDALGGGGNHTGDAGFLDQRAALRWAKDNAAAFGGDPNRLLLFGESAGAASVSMHSISPLSRGLFSRAAMQSTTCVTPRDRGASRRGARATHGDATAGRRQAHFSIVVACVR